MQKNPYEIEGILNKKNLTTLSDFYNVLFFKITPYR